MTVLSEILDWATTQEDWKQDIIRRILTRGEYSEDDVKDVTAIILSKFGYMKNPSVAVTLIKKSEFLSLENCNSHKIILRKLECPQNINALSSDAKLQFALDGLTIIYGENGVGKSGYSKVLKKICKARSVDDVLSNVFSENTTGHPSVKLEFSKDDEVIVHDWIDGSEENEFLQQVVVYDNKCGKIQVTDKNELIYLPSGTDIFKKIIDCIIDVKSQLEIKKPQEVKINLDKIDEKSKIYQQLKAINKDSSKENLESELEWNIGLENEINAVNRKLLDANEGEVKKKIALFDKEINNLEKIKRDFEQLEKSYTEDKIKNLSNILKNKAESEKALEELSRQMNTDEMIQGTGNELWRVMYASAKEFSDQYAYPEVSFPDINKRCVLCQQELGKDAQARFLAFKNFAEGKIKKNHDDLVLKLDESIKYLEGQNLKIEELTRLLEQSFTCLSAEHANVFKTKLENIDACRIKFIESIKSNNGVSLSCDSDNDSLIILFDEIIFETKKQKIELEKAINPDCLKQLKEKKINLDSLKIANSKKKDFFAYIDYLKTNDNYQNMIKSLDHSSISRKGTTIITNALKDTFLKALTLELSKLGGEKIPLFIDSSTKDGKPTFQLILKGANMPPKSKIDAILSEGEQKIASLAGFLAELDTAKHNNGIILDDPVTSLDHQYRKNIAQRLVQEAKGRQVIIFTHDIAFLYDLDFFAKELRVPTHLQNIRKDGLKSGVIFNTNPWHAQNVKMRIKTLNDELDSLKQKNLTGEEYNNEAGMIYGRIRETWERAVEEILFNEVVTRFGQSVQTQRLNGVTVEDDDFTKIYSEMAKCSKYMIGHDKSLSLSDSRPIADDIKQDICAISEFANKVNKRKDEIIKKRKAEVDKPPAAKVVE